MIKKIAALFLGLISVLPAAYADSAATNAPIKIGAIYNMTGDQASLGGPSSRGAQLAVQQINAAGGVLGRPLKLILLDGKTQPAVITAEAKKLAADKDVVAVIGLSDTDMAMAAIPPLAAAKKLFFTSGATAPKLVKMAPGYVFMACFADNQQASAAAEFAFEKLQGKTALLLTQKDAEYTRLLAHYFQGSFTKVGGKVIAQESFTQKKLDLAADLKKLKDQKVAPDVIYLAAEPTTIVPMIKQLRQAGFTQPILGGDSFDNPALLAMGDAANNVYYTTHGLLTKDNSDPQVQRFVSDYQAAYQQAPENSFAGLGYDTVKLLANAIRKADSTDTNKIREALLQIKFFDVVTGMLSYLNNNPIPMKTVIVLEIKDNNRTLAAEFTPQDVVE
jgi:branched-chain amino acid transport system substrate-binding protein